MPNKLSLRDLFPNESEDQIDHVRELLNDYCSVVLRIFERLEEERPEVIDALMKARNMKAKVDSSNNTN